MKLGHLDHFPKTVDELEWSRGHEIGKKKHKERPKASHEVVDEGISFKNGGESWNSKGFLGNIVSK